MYTQQMSQYLGVVGFASVATAAAGSSTATEAIDLSKSRRCQFLLAVNGFGVGGSGQILVQGATASGGTYTTITSLSSNYLTGSGVVRTEATAEGIQSLGSSYTWIKGVANITGGNVSGAVLIAQASVVRNEPASNQNKAYVPADTVF